MPLPVQTKLYNTFASGLITEANPLVYPEGTAKSLSNVDLSRNGVVSRRLGMDVESDGKRSNDTWSTSDIKSVAITTHHWPSVNGDGTRNFTVHQIGKDIYFHNAGAAAISNDPIGKLDLTLLKINDDFDKEPIDVSVGVGRLFIVNKYISPLYIEYDAENNIFTGYKLSLKIRDLDGIPEDNDSSPIITSAEATLDEDENAVLFDTVETIDNLNFTIVLTLEDIGEVGGY